MKEVIEGWIARDLGPINAQDLNIGKLRVWPRYPYRNKIGCFWMPNFPQDIAIIEIPKDKFTSLKWKDEPLKVKVTIETIE